MPASPERGDVMRQFVGGEWFLFSMMRVFA